ncbi:MAG: M48 family metallopeptidase [Actinomycetota bacterium]
MFEQIARNKRRSIIYVVVFFIVWMGLGALVGLAIRAGNPQSTMLPIAWGIAITGAFAVLSTIFALTSGAQAVLSMAGARPATIDAYPQLHNIVEGLAIGDGIPKPAVYVIDDHSPNAFATGTSPKRAAITVTTGLLEIMNRDELEGVIAHEMSHIHNYDVRFILIISTLIGMIALFASALWQSLRFMRLGRSRNGGQIVLLIVAAAIVLSIVGFVIGPIIRFGVSRRREELADVSGVKLSRNPAGLLSALEKLQQNDKPFAKFNHATACMCIDDPLQHHNSWYHHLFDTHPPIEERIAILKKLIHADA